MNERNERNERKEYMAVSAYHVISKEIENPSLDSNEFLDTRVCINNHIDKVVSFCSNNI